MESIMYITPSNCMNYNAARHADFQDRVFGAVNSGQVPLEALHIDSGLMEEWRKWIDLETDVAVEVTTSLYTEDMRKADKERVRLLVYLFTAIRAAALAPIGPQGEAGRTMMPVVNAGKGMQTGSRMRKTANIIALLMDLNKPMYAEAIEVLKLREIITALEAANDEYERLENERSSERVRRRLPAGKKVRPHTDGCYERVCRLIEASHLLCTAPATKAAIKALIDHINQIILESKSKFRQIKGLKRAAARRANTPKI